MSRVYENGLESVKTHWPISFGYTEHDDDSVAVAAPVHAATRYVLIRAISNFASNSLMKKSRKLQQIFIRVPLTHWEIRIYT